MFAEILANLSTISVVLFVAGVALLVAEMFHPGWGVAGAVGVVCMILDVIITAKTWQQGLLLTAAVLVVLLAFLIACIVLAQHGKLPGKLILKQSTVRAEGFTAAQVNTPEEKAGLLGAQGVAVTVLRPAGIAQLAGKRWDVVTQGEFIPKGAAVQVTETDSNRIVVQPVKTPAEV